MYQLKTEKRHQFGRNVVLPIVGEVPVSETGVIEVVSKEEAEQLHSIQCGFVLQESKSVEAITPEPEVTELKEQIVEIDLGKGTEGDNLHSSPAVEEKIPEVTEVGTTSENGTEETATEGITTNTENIRIGVEQQGTEVQIGTIEGNKTPEETFQDMTVAELQELAKPFDKKEWSTLKKAELVQYLVGKLELSQKS